VEQFRIYEAIEAGSIPVMELADGYTREHVPPEYNPPPPPLSSRIWPFLQCLSRHDSGHHSERKSIALPAALLLNRYMESPMVFVQSWEEVVETLAGLAKVLFSKYVYSPRSMRH